MNRLSKRAVSLLLSGMFVLSNQISIKASDFGEDNSNQNKTYLEDEFPHYPRIGKLDPKEYEVFNSINNFETMGERIERIRKIELEEYEQYCEYLKQFQNKIEIVNENQYPELPNGCEIVSCFIVLRYLGFEINKFDLADNYLNKSNNYYGQDPNVVYMGNPRNSSGPSAGFYCFSDPIVEAANEYVTNNNGDYLFNNATGLDEQGIIEELKNDRPVIVWATLNFNEPSLTGMSWNDQSGNPINIYRNLHCLIVSGYNKTEFHITDPIYGQYWISKDKFLDVFTKMGSKAVTHQKVLTKERVRN